jgi:hypothetical protein
LPHPPPGWTNTILGVIDICVFIRLRLGTRPVSL